MLNQIQPEVFKESINNKAILKKTIHETSFLFNKDSNHILTDIPFDLYCDASTLDRSQYINPMALDEPNSILAGIVKYKNIDYVCYKKNIICNDNNMAELLAIKEGLELAQHLKIKCLNIYTDSSVSITFIKKHIQKNSVYMNNIKFTPITTEIINILNKFDICNFIHVPRKENKQADKLTKFKRSHLFK